MYSLSQNLSTTPPCALPPLPPPTPLWPDPIRAEPSELQEFTNIYKIEDFSSDLFENVEPVKIKEIFRSVATIAGEGETLAHLSTLRGLLESDQYIHNLWEHEIFSHSKIDYYILLLYLMRHISQPELATLHTMSAAIRYYQEEKIPFHSIPLFLEHGEINSHVFNGIGATTNMEDPEKRKEWFEKMRGCRQCERHFIYAHGLKSADGQSLSNVMTLILKAVNILYDAGVEEEWNFVPSVGGVLAILSFIGGPYPCAPYFRYDLGDIREMRKHQKQDPPGRVASLPASFCPTPCFADRSPAPGPLFILHDLLYHLYLFTYIPPDHVDFFMDWHERMEKELSTMTDLPLRALLSEFTDIIVDADFRNYLPNPDPLRNPCGEDVAASALLLSLCGVVSVRLENFLFFHPTCDRKTFKHAFFRLFFSTLKPSDLRPFLEERFVERFRSYTYHEQISFAAELFPKTSRHYEVLQKKLREAPPPAFWAED